MFDDRNRSISNGLDWCVSALDTLQEMTPEHAMLCGLDMVLGWKAALERVIEVEDEQA